MPNQITDTWTILYTPVTQIKFAHVSKLFCTQELCATLQELAYGEGLNQFTVKTKEQAWYISYADGCLRGLGWESFVIAHTLREDDTLLFSMDVDLNLIAMVFDREGCERTFYWYTNTDDDATSFNQETQ